MISPLTCCGLTATILWKLIHQSLESNEDAAQGIQADLGKSEKSSQMQLSRTQESRWELLDLLSKKVSFRQNDPSKNKNLYRYTGLAFVEKNIKNISSLFKKLI